MFAARARRIARHLFVGLFDAPEEIDYDATGSQRGSGIIGKTGDLLAPSEPQRS